jgi:hypothetical protein
LTPDKAGAFEGEDHLVDGWRGDAEVPLHIGFGRRAAKDATIGIDEGEVLTLFFGEGGSRKSRAKQLIHRLIRLASRIARRLR